MRKSDPQDLLYKHTEPCPEDLLDREGVDINGGVWRYHPTKDRFEVVAHGFSIDRRHIRRNEDIRLIGVYTPTVQAYAEVEAQVKVRDVPDGDVEAAQAAEWAAAAESATAAGGGPAAAADPRPASASACRAARPRGPGPSQARSS